MTKMRCQTVVNNIIYVGDKMELVVVASNAAQEMDAVRRALILILRKGKMYNLRRDPWI